jgi:hypothetical protein
VKVTWVSVTATASPGHVTRWCAIFTLMSKSTVPSPLKVTVLSMMKGTEPQYLPDAQAAQQAAKRLRDRQLLVAAIAVADEEAPHGASQASSERRAFVTRLVERVPVVRLPCPPRPLPQQWPCDERSRQHLGRRRRRVRHPLPAVEDLLRLEHLHPRRAPIVDAPRDGPVPLLLLPPRRPHTVLEVLAYTTYEVVSKPGAARGTGQQRQPRHQPHNEERPRCR